MSSRLVRVLIAGLLVGLLMWSSFAWVVVIASINLKGQFTLANLANLLALGGPVLIALRCATALLAALLGWLWARSRNGGNSLGLSAVVAGVAAVVGFVLGFGLVESIGFAWLIGDGAALAIAAAGLLSVGASALFLVAVGAVKECQGQGS